MQSRLSGSVGVAKACASRTGRVWLGRNLRPNSQRNLVAYLTLAVSACDPLVTTSYRGEPRLSLAVRVSSDMPTSASAVPALAHVDETQVLFRALDIHGTYPEFRVDVVDAPDAERLVPVDPFLAPDVVVAREYIGSVIESRLGKPIVLNPRVLPLLPDCWDNECDYVPGQMSTPCEEDDDACRRRQRQCPNGMCEIVPKSRVYPEGAEDVRGFVADYTVLYTPAAIPARSWAALKLGAPQGLESGYHLGKRLDSSGEARVAADGCVEEARTAAFDRFNAQHGTAYDGHTLSCLTSRSDHCLKNEALPEGKVANELADVVKAEEVERGCLGLAPDMEFIREPSQEQISVLVTTEAPDWFPTVPPAPPPVAGRDEVDCSGPLAEELVGWDGKPLPAVNMTSYTGSFCPEDSLYFSESEGSFSIQAQFEQSGRCEISLAVTVPPGYRFRRPAFAIHGYGFRETEDVRPPRIAMSYAMTPNAGSEPPMTSQHVVWTPILGSEFSDSFQLLDTPQLTVPECRADCEASELELKIAVDMDTPEGAYTTVSTLEGLFEFGAEWTACHRDFPAR